MNNKIVLDKSVIEERIVISKDLAIHIRNAFLILEELNTDKEFKDFYALMRYRIENATQLIDEVNKVASDVFDAGIKYWQDVEHEHKQGSEIENHAPNKSEFLKSLFK